MKFEILNSSEEKMRGVGKEGGAKEREGMETWQVGIMLICASKQR